MRRARVEICRAWVATVTTAAGDVYTTTVHGPNPTEAEQRYSAAHPGDRVVLRLELPR